MFDFESRFWSTMTAWRAAGSTGHPEFRSLSPPAELPLQLLLQRLDEERDEVVGHLDLACDDRTAETDRHVGLGATVIRRTDGWTTLRDAAGLDYCITDRDPVTGGR